MHNALSIRLTDLGGYNMDLTGIEVLVKLFVNSSNKDKDDNKLMTRTLGKIALLDKDFEGDKKPEKDEFWRCKIIRETNPGQNSGCFILEPLTCVPSEEVFKLVPGMYDEKEESGTLLILPHKNGLNAILPLKVKKNLKRVNSIIVALST